MKLSTNDISSWRKRERREKRRAAKRAKLSEIDMNDTEMSALESKAMEEARARALQVAAEAAEIAAEEAETLRRDAQRKAQQEQQREKECITQTPQKRQKQGTDYMPTSPELYRYRHHLHRWLLLSMYNYESSRSVNDEDGVHPGDCNSDTTSDSD